MHLDIHTWQWPIHSTFMSVIVCEIADENALQMPVKHLQKYLSITNILKLRALNTKHTILSEQYTDLRYFSFFFFFVSFLEYILSMQVSSAE